MFKYEHCFNWCPGYKGTYDEWVVFVHTLFRKVRGECRDAIEKILCKRAEEYHVRVRCTSDRVKNTRDIDDGIIEMCKREGPVPINAAKAFCYIYYSERRFIDDVIKEVEDLFQYENYVEFGSCYGDKITSRSFINMISKLEIDQIRNISKTKFDNEIGYHFTMRE